MALTGEDMKWLGEKFEGLNASVVQAVKAHEERFHPPGHAMKTIGALLGICVAGLTILGALFAVLQRFIQHTP